MSLLKHLSLFILLLWLAIVIAGPEIDKRCIEGRFSVVQATAVNALAWEKCPKYRDGNCYVEKGDRVLTRECSELSKSIFMQKPLLKLRKWWRNLPHR